MVDLSGRVILITGAGRGLGLAYARTIAELGAMVLIQDPGRDTAGTGADWALAPDAAAALRAAGLAAHAMTNLIDTCSQCHALVAEALALAGRLDGIIHNAGWVAYEPIAELRETSFDRMMDIAAKAPMWLAQAAWPSMRSAGHGRIVITTSDRALYPEHARPGLAAYAAAKMAALGIMHVLAAEGAEHGIVVNAISPVARTRMWGEAGEPDELRAEDVAPGAAFLVSDACTEGGWILRASNGQFHATRASEAAGVAYPGDLRGVAAATAAEVAAAWPRIARRAVEPRA